ncbi:MAG: EF-P lysine aminoacylase GenX [Cardiobacteriaceae bacterium]|nr:EF-P lysine aminoacylase GenX [Cardiobacteriaceae bacterium]
MSNFQNLREKIAARADKFAEIRDFFRERGVLEVDTQVLREFAVTDPNLCSLEVSARGKSVGFLATSPEYAMKILLAGGSGAIYQFAHIFRGEEEGRRHLREFSLVEWYRPDFSLDELMAEVADLLQILLRQKLSVKKTSYGELFRAAFGVDIFSAEISKIAAIATKIVPESAAWNLDRDAYLDLLFTHEIEPHLGKNCLEFIVEYLPSQAALAKLSSDKNGNLTAARFEAYIAGVELCNAFDELASSSEQRARFLADNRKRAELNLPVMKIDEEFLYALDNLPSCAGVALGLDRVLMLAWGMNNIREVIYI